MKRCLILVEGQTEERFVKDVLTPYYAEKNIFITPTILTTKVVKDGANFKGGVTRYIKIKNDLSKLLNDSSVLVTTLIDYYGLPTDTPGMGDRPMGSAVERVTHVENAIHTDMGSPKNLIPFLALHEFEALLFTDPQITAATLLERDKADALTQIASGLQPEEINEHVESAPSKRIVSVFPAFRKTLHGPTAAKRIGLSKLREKCPHFNQWLDRIESF